MVVVTPEEVVVLSAPVSLALLPGPVVVSGGCEATAAAWAEMHASPSYLCNLLKN